MLDKNQIRQLAYLVKIDKIEPIPGRDRVESATVNCWTCMVNKNTLAEGDYAVYFEIDSKCPAVEPFLFLEQKHYKIKTQKYALRDENGNKVGQYWSQGLVLPLETFVVDGVEPEWLTKVKSLIADGVDILATDDRFLTAALGVTYASPEDNKRKAKTPDKYTRMGKRYPKLFRTAPIRWLMRRTWGKKLLFFFLGRKADTKKAFWPEWVVKTDEERIENLPWRFHELDKETGEKRDWYFTEKIDGTSTTFTLTKNGKKKLNYYVCSRNVCFDTSEKQENGAYYDTNVYVAMSKKYAVESALRDILATPDPYAPLKFVTLQGETYGKNIQKREYGLNDIDFMAFNLIFGYEDGAVKRLNPVEMTMELERYNIPCVPYLGIHKLPDTLEELREIVNSEGSKVDGDMREGIVFRSKDGVESFKCVSPDFLVKYHG